MRNLILIISFISLFSFYGKAQDVDIAVTNKFDSKTKTAEIKWYPANIKAWVAGYKNGYNLYRSEVFANGEYIKKPTRVKLNDAPLKINISELTEQTAGINDIALYIVADSLKEKLQDVPTNQLFDAANASDLSFTVMIFRLAQNTKAAQKCGLYFVDSNIDLSKKYYYELEIDGEAAWKSLRSWLEPSEQQAYPQPKNFVATTAGRALELKWNVKYYKDPFIGYNMYRSTKEKGAYEKVNKRIISVNELTLVNNGNAMILRDSIPEYGKAYYYYIKGVGHFDDESEPSEIQKVIAYKKLEKTPINFSFETNEKGQVQLHWDLDEIEKPSVKEVRIYKSIDPLSQADFLASVVPTITTYTDTTIQYSAYYTMCTVGYGGEELCDFPREIMVRDTIAPAAPKNLQGKVDFNGVVSINWEVPSDKDLMGFLVYRAYRRNHEFNKLTAVYQVDSIFVDTLDLNLLYPKIYYVAAAVDPFYNIAYSDTFELILPDKHPPLSPKFTNYKSTVKGIELTWYNSSSKDVIQEVIYRKGDKDLNYRPLVKLSGKDLQKTTYTDADTKERHFYKYIILAYDASGLISDTSSVLSVEQVMNPIRPKIEDITAVVSRENELLRISWNYNQEGVTRYLVYKAKEGQKITAYKTISKDTPELIEKSLTPNTGYIYRIVAEFKNGARSAMSDEITAQY